MFQKETPSWNLMFYVKNEWKVEQNNFLGTSYAINLQDPALMIDFHQFNVHVQLQRKNRKKTCLNPVPLDFLQVQ